MKALTTFLKLIIIGIATTIVRAVFQGFIPVVGEPLLWPSVFVDGGIMPLAFMSFGSLFYTMVASLYILIDKNLGGKRILKGLKFSFLFIIIWVVYLLEPLPHVMPLDKLTYPLADSGALLAMGIFIGLLVATDGKKNFDENTEVIKVKRAVKFSVLNVIIIGFIFFLGRLAMYRYLGLYSSFGMKPVETLLWALGTGLAIGVVYELVAPYICTNRFCLRFFVFGLVFFGVNLVAFNGFMPVVFRIDVVDLAYRTLGDIAFVVVGGAICLGFDFKKMRVSELNVEKIGIEE